MMSVEAKPLLAEDIEAARGTEEPRTDNSDGGDDAEHSYTDLHSLTRPSKAASAPSASTKNALTTINGVYVPCLLNIIGVILFLRLGWGIGQAGVEGMLWIFFMAETQAVLTALSASTIASNGAMQGGGSYFLISRSLGPEFGGAIGLQFYFLYAVGISMFLVGFAEEAQQTWFPDPETISKRWVVVLLASGALLVVLIIAMIGAEAFSKVNKYLFMLQFACMLVGAIFIFVLGPHDLENGGRFTGPSVKVLNENLAPHFTTEQGACGDGVVCTLPGIYAIVFPLATGFMEGLNLSGDLKNPGRSIPVGTLAAVGTSCVVYVTLIFTFASSFTGKTLRNNFTFFQEVSDYPFVVIIGVLVSCFSSGLGSLFGASRILQAIARDDIFSLLKPMSQGSAVGDEPQHAVLFTAALTQVFICLGDLDVIAPICTSFFCLAYASVNLTCFLLQVTGVPNFRPSFQYHSWQLSLLGTVLNVGVMIYLNATYAALSLVVLCCLFFYLYFTGSPKAWGDISQALMYHQVRKYLLRLDARKAHSKFWRPSILLLTKEIDCAEVKLCHNLKKGGLYVIANVVVGDFSPVSNDQCSEAYQRWLGHIFDTKLKAIPQMVVATQVRDGYRMLMQTSGLGGMQINTIVVPWVDGLKTTETDPRGPQSNLLGLCNPLEFVGLLADAILLRKNVVVLRHADRLDGRLFAKTARADLALDKLRQHDQRGVETVDVWITCDWDDDSAAPGTALMLQLAYVLYSNPAWRRRTAIRLLKLCTSSDAASLQRERVRLAAFAERLRVSSHVSEVLAIPLNATSILADSTTPCFPSVSSYFKDAKSAVELNQVLQRNSTRAAQLVLMLPDPRAAAPSADTAAEYLSKLELLTSNLPATMLVWNGDDDAVISTGI